MSLMGRYRTPSQGESMQGFGRAMMGAGAGLIEKANLDEYNSQMTRFKAESLEETNNLDSWLDANPKNPEAWEGEFFEKEFWPKYEARAKEGKSGKALKEIQQELPYKKQLMVSHVRNRRSEQAKINALAAKDVFVKRINNLDATTGLQLAETSNDLLEALENIRRSGADPALQSDEAVFEQADMIMSPAVMRFLVANPHKLNEDGTIAEGGEDYWINHPNEFAEENGINAKLGRPILTSEEQTKLKSDYLSKKSIEERGRRAAFENSQNLAKQAILDRFLNRQFFADPQNNVKDDIYTFINSTSLEPDEKEQWMVKARNWAKSMDEKAQEDDNRALFDAGQIVNKVRDKELSAIDAFDELQKLATKLTEETMDTKINQLSAADKPDEIVNDPVNKLYADAIQDMIVGRGRNFDVSGMRQYEETIKAWESFVRANPTAAPTQKRDKFNEIMEPFLKSRFEKFLEFLEWDEFKGEVKWLVGAGKRKKVTATKGKEAAPEESKIKPSNRYVLGEVVTNKAGRKGKIVGFREEDGKPLIEPID